jgi:hypothetical protein
VGQRIKYLLVEVGHLEIRVQAAFHLQVKSYMVEPVHLLKGVFSMEKTADLDPDPY